MNIFEIDTADRRAANDACGIGNGLRTLAVGIDELGIFEMEIDALYSRIAEGLRRENEALRAELEKLRRERGE